MTSPLPSTLTSLPLLPSHPTGSKVRFLGWYLFPFPYLPPHYLQPPSVTAYTSKTGHLHLQYTGSTITALVNLELVGPTVKPTDTQVGEWVNVIGYVQEKGSVRRGGEKGGRGGEKGRKEVVVKVQAVMMWSAGAVRLEEYDRAVQGRIGSEHAV
jgi:hypothetical protein